MHVIFENIGEIDPLLIKTFGVNVKVCSNPIGFFGTGLKYALAILVRMGISISIQTGITTLNFDRKAVLIRGKEFEFVAMNDELLGFTTELGKNWAPWMTYRELYCNCIDEGGRCYQLPTLPSPRAGWTRIIVSDPRFTAIVEDHKKYFLDSTPLFISNEVEIHHGESKAVYYRKVNVGFISDKPSLFTYNILSDLVLTEDRIIKDQYYIKPRLAKAIGMSDNSAIIRKALLAPDEWLEASFDFDNYFKPSQTFLEAVESLMRNLHASLNITAKELYYKHTDKRPEPDAYVMTVVEQKMLARAIAFAKKIRFPVDDYPILVVESMGDSVVGLAKEGKIYLTF